MITSRGSSASVGSYALFAYAPGAKVQSVNTSLTTADIADLSRGRRNPAGGSVGDYALFAGGYESGYLGAVDVYDASLTKTVTTDLSKARESAESARAGDFLLFGGGMISTGNSAATNVVDAYTI